MATALAICAAFWLLSIFEAYVLPEKQSKAPFSQIFIIHLVIFILFLITIGGVSILCLEKKYKADKLVEKSERMYQDIFENVMNLYSETLIDGTIIKMSPSVKKILGYEHEEVKGKNIDIIYREPELRQQILKRLLEEKSIENVEFEGIKKDGSICILLLNFKIVDVQDGSRKIICIGKDVTDYVEAKKKQIEVQEEYKLIFDKMLDGMIISEFIFDENNNPANVTVVKANPRIIKQFGVKDSTDIGNMYIKYFVENKAELEKLYYILKTGIPSQREIFLPKFDLYLFVNTFKINSRQIGMMFNDISELKQMEKRQKEMAAQLEAIFESTDDIIYSVDTKYNIINFNSALKDFIKRSYNCDIKRGQSFMKFVPYKIAKEWKNYYDNAIGTGRHNFEYYIRHEKRYLDVFFNPIYDNEKVCGTAVFTKDITARKEAEQQLRKINRDLEELVDERTRELLNTCTELEAFTYTVSHDLKSPLRAIDGYSRIILEDYGQTLEKEAVRMITNISDVSCDMINLIDRVLQYSTTYKAGIQKEKVDIKEIFLNVFYELKTTCLERSIEFNVVASMPLVFADKILIKQMIYNILSNAVKFTKNREIAVINVGYIKNGSEHIFYVEDNGAGFDMEYSGKLFTMFQRLHIKNEFEGSGIGLATVKKIIQKHEGKVWIESKQNKGTRISFTLPIE